MPRASTFTDWWDRIANLSIPHAEKAVLQCLARHGDWSDGTHSYPKIKTIADETSYSEGVVRRALRSLECDALDTDCTRPYCRHLGLIVCTERSRQYAPAVYALILAERAFQSHLPEVSDRSIRARRPVATTTQGNRSDRAG